MEIEKYICTQIIGASHPAGQPFSKAFNILV